MSTSPAPSATAPLMRRRTPTATSNAWVRLVLADLRTGVPPIFGVLSCMVAVGLGFAVAHPDQSQWADRFNLALLVCAFTGPLAFAGAAAHTGALNRQGLLDLAATSGRGRYAFARIGAAASLTFALLAGALSAVVLLHTVPPRPPLTAAMLLLPTTAVLLTVLCSLVGSVAGARHPSTLVPVTGAAAVFAWLYGGTLLPGTANLVSPVDSGSSYEPFTQPNPALYAGFALALAAAAGLAWALLHDQTRMGRVITAGVAAAAVASGVLLAAVGGTDRLVMLPPPERPACDAAGRVSVCLWPGMADQLPTVLAAATAVTTELGPYLTVPDTFDQEGLAPQPGVAVFRLSTLDTDIDTNKQRMIDALIPPCPSGALDNSARDALLAWARSRLHTDFSEYDTTAAQVTALPPAEQQRWVDDKLDQISRC